MSRFLNFFGGLRTSSILYLAGFFLVFVGERVVGGEETARWVLDGVGLLAILGGLGLVASAMSGADADQKASHKLGLLFGVIGALSLADYALGSDTVVNAIGFGDDESEHRYKVVISCLWPIAWLVGTLPFLAIERALAANPVKVVHARVKDGAVGALGFALLLAALFPINFVAQDTNERWDNGYFKTAQPGTATVSMVQALAEPLRVYLFFPAQSDVREEVRTYFDHLSDGPLQIEYVDHALEPDLAKELKVRDNGNIALVRGEGEEQQVERISLGADFDKAKRKLKKLDGDFQKALIKLTRGQRVAYFTTGHGELSWKGGSEIDPLRKIGNVKSVLKQLNYKVEELSLADGLGSEIPEDATMVWVLGPTSEFLPEEVETLNRYRELGGSLYIALEPDGAKLEGLLGPLGMAYDPTRVLTHQALHLKVYNSPRDRRYLVTDKFSTHESVTSLSRNQGAFFMVAGEAGVLTQTKDKDAAIKTTVTVRSQADTFADVDGDFNPDPDEEKATFNLVMAATGPATLVSPSEQEPAEFKAIVAADATMLADPAMPIDQTRGNLIFFAEVANWLAGDVEAQGTTNSEDDVKIEHTKEGQGWWFYGTTVLIPFGLFFMGLTRIRLRKRRTSP